MPTKCPEHPEATLDKTMEKAIKWRGIWYPGFKCPVDGKVFDYEQVMGSEKARMEVARIEYAEITPEKVRKWLKEVGEL